MPATQNGTAPEQVAPEQVAPESAPTLDIASAVESEDISKGTRVYLDVPGCPRVPTPSGRIAVVQRERRADGTDGEYMGALITPPREKGAPEGARRMSIGEMQELKSALESAGVTILR